MHRRTSHGGPRLVALESLGPGRDSTDGAQAAIRPTALRPRSDRVGQGPHRAIDALRWKVPPATVSHRRTGMRNRARAGSMSRCRVTRCYDAAMRTTVSLEPDNDLAIRRLMRERGLTFKQAVNQAIREGITPRPVSQAYRTPTFSMGPPRVPIDKAMRLAAELEDEEIMRKLAQRK